MKITISLFPNYSKEVYEVDKVQFLETGELEITPKNWSD